MEKRKFFICISILLIFLVFTTVGLFFGDYFFNKASIPLIVGFVSWVVAGLLVLAFKHNSIVLILCIIICAFGSGLAMSAYYIDIKALGYEINRVISSEEFFKIEFIVASICLVIYIVYDLLLKIEAFNKHIKLFTYPFIAIVLVTAIILWLIGANTGFKEEITNPLIFFNVFITMLLIFPLILVASDYKDVFRNSVYASLGIVLLISIIVLLILSEGDVDLDFSTGGGDSKLAVEDPNKSKINRNENFGL